MRLKTLLDLIIKRLGVDYIVEQGTSNSWVYKKWNSGRYECYKRFTYSEKHYTTAMGGYGYLISAINYPIAFIEKPYVSVGNCRVGNGFAIFGGTVGTETTTTTNVYLLGTASGTQTIEFVLYLIGKWK